MEVSALQRFARINGYDLIQAETRKHAERLGGWFALSRQKDNAIVYVHSRTEQLRGWIIARG